MSKSRDAVEDIRTIDTVTATANAALPKAGGALTGNLVATNVTASGVLSDPSGNVRAGRKNIFINGDFSVNQRGTGATTGGTYLTADRWKAGTTTLTFETVANDRDLSIANMLKVTSHTNGYGIIVQAAEDVRTTSGQNVTLSFWAKTANFSSFRLELQQNFGSGGSGTVTVVDNASYFSVPNTGWNQYTATIAMPSISGKTVGTSSYLNMVLGPNSGTSNGITYYSEVQLELGSVATDFEHRSYGEELALCQRYYERVDYSAYASSATIYAACVFKVTKRAVPTMTFISATVSASQSSTVTHNVNVLSVGFGGSSWIGGLWSADSEL